MNEWPLISSRFPYVPVRVVIGAQSLALEALLDTGFNGDLVLPPGALSRVPPSGLTFTGVLADGSSVRAPAYLADVEIGTRRIESVTLVSLGDVPLVGRRLISRFRVTLDHGERVIVEP